MSLAITCLSLTDSAPDVLWLSSSTKAQWKTKVLLILDGDKCIICWAFDLGVEWLACIGFVDTTPSLDFRRTYLFLKRLYFCELSFSFSSADRLKRWTYRCLTAPTDNLADYGLSTSFGCELLGVVEVSLSKERWLAINALWLILHRFLISRFSRSVFGSLLDFK